jgi:hypothetical protein
MMKEGVALQPTILKKTIQGLLKVFRNIHHFWEVEFEMSNDATILIDFISRFMGMQIYSPFTRKASRKRIVKGHDSMMRFSSIVKQILYPDTFFHEDIQYTTSVNDFLSKMEWLEAHKDSYLRDLLNFGNASVRMEFFLEYRGADDDAIINENLDRLPNLSSAMRLVETRNLKGYLEKKLTDNIKPFEKLRDTIITHRSSGTVPSLRQMGPTIKAAMVVHAELLVANLDFHPYKPKTLVGMMKVGNTLHANKTGSWRIPERFQVPISVEEQGVTGLMYGVPPTFLNKRIKVSSIGEPSLRERDSDLLERASKYKKSTRLPVFFLQAVDKLKAILYHYSREAPIDTIDPFVNAGRQVDENQNSPSDYVDLDPDFEVDYSYLSNTLSKERRNDMEGYICMVILLLYDQNYCDLLTNPRYPRSEGRKLPNGIRSVDTFPKCKFDVINTMTANLFDNNNLGWSIVETEECKSPGKFDFYDFRMTYPKIVNE